MYHIRPKFPLKILIILAVVSTTTWYFVLFTGVEDGTILHPKASLGWAMRLAIGAAVTFLSAVLALILLYSWSSTCVTVSSFGIALQQFGLTIPWTEISAFELKTVVHKTQTGTTWSTTYEEKLILHLPNETTNMVVPLSDCHEKHVETLISHLRKLPTTEIKKPTSAIH